MIRKTRPSSGEVGNDGQADLPRRRSHRRCTQPNAHYAAPGSRPPARAAGSRFQSRCQAAAAHDRKAAVNAGHTIAVNGRRAKSPTTAAAAPRSCATRAISTPPPPASPTKLSRQYYLGYPSRGYRDGRWHTIRVDVRHPGLTVRARKGYIATS